MATGRSRDSSQPPDSTAAHLTPSIPSTPGAPAISGQSNPGPFIVLALVLFALTGLFVGTRDMLPSDLSNRLPNAPTRAPYGVAITPFPRPGNPLRPGDVVVAVNGTSIARGRLPRGRIGQHFIYTVRRAGHLLNVEVVLHHYPLEDALATSWATMLMAVTLGGVALYVFARRPHHRAAQALLMVAGLFSCGATAWVLWPGALDNEWGVGWWVTVAANLAYALMWGALLHFALVFPRPRGIFAPRPGLVGLAYLLPLALYGTYLAVVLPRALTPLQSAGYLTSTSVFGDYVMPAAVMVTLVRAYRGIEDAGARHGLRWFMILFSGGIVGWLLIWKLPDLLFGRALLGAPLPPLMFLPCLFALALAILRDRVFDIDIVIRRSVVYISLTVCAVVIYVTTVGLLGKVISHRGQWTSVLATALVAVAFSPLHSRLQRGVSRLFYGERDDPYAMLSRLGQQLEGTRGPSEILPLVVDTMAEALRLPYVAVELADSEGTELAAQHGAACAEPLALPLSHQGQHLGRLLIGERSRGEGFAPTDCRLFADLARQVSVAARTVTVARDLQRSRERLVAAREEERRRLQRDLHDGLGPALGAAVLQLQAVKRLVRADPDQAELIISRLTKETQATIADVRRLVDQLRPAALNQYGLLEALRLRASNFVHLGSDEPNSKPLDIDVESDGDLSGLPAAVEMAAFRIVCEAVNNAARHAGASRCVVRLVRAGALEVWVADDGRGLPAACRPGVGLSSMGERAAELGGWCRVEAAAEGGVVVHAHLPIPAP